MADREREREDPLAEQPGVRDQDAPRDSPPTEPVQAQAHSPRCPECACAELTLIKDAEIVSLYKCPKCGHLTAPVKRT
jgi:predicted RNA-binding Zn-ribbon protein involved in translation (DUF1610 family)